MVKVKRVLGVIIILALLVSSAPFFSSTGPVLAQDGEYESFSPELAEQVAEICQQKQVLTPVQRKIAPAILQVVREVKERISAAHPRETPRLRDLSMRLLKVDDAGNIEVKLSVTSLGDEQIEQVEARGMQIGLTLPKYGVIEGSLPYDQVEAVAGFDFVVNVGTPGYALHRTGDVNSEGDTVLRATETRAAFGVDGSGVKVGVISDGVTHLSNSVATGDLPSSPAVDVLKAGSGDEGTAMLEIIYDLAPGASLAFYSPDTSSDMVAGIGDLATAGCDIIVDDIGWSDEPKFEDGPIAQEARAFCTGGGVYVTSAGNSAQRHYIHQYVRTTGPGGDYLYAHDYEGGDVGNTFTVPNGGTIVTILQWNNQWGLAGDDFALILARSSDGAFLTGCDNYQTGDGDPWEAFDWTNDTGSSLTVHIAVLEYSLVNSPSSLILDYHVWYASGLEYSMSENSVIGHAAVEEVLSTAAADAATPDTIESFSSHGPGTIYFPTYENRQVPNITGVDGVHTKTGELGYFYDPFYGTSASAPHVAAIAALVWEADPTLTPSDVHNAITSTAVDKPPAGYDYTWGFGLADAYEAVASVALTPPLPPTMEPIAEAEGQYYNTAPSFSNFGFDDDVALDDGWYQMDSYTEPWIGLFTDVAGTSWDNDGWTIPGFDGLAEGSHTIYFKASDDADNVEGESGEWSWQFFKDTTPPSNPTGVSSTSHTTSVWSSDNTIDVTWTDATDNLSGLDGYSILWDTNSNTVPDQIKDIEEEVQAATSPVLANGNSHYFHIRSVDNAGNWQSTVHLGPFFIDTPVPTVGGTIVLVDKLELVMPWVIVTALIMVAGIWRGIWNRKRRIGSPSDR